MSYSWPKKLVVTFSLCMGRLFIQLSFSSVTEGVTYERHMLSMQETLHGPCQSARLCPIGNQHVIFTCACDALIFSMPKSHCCCCFLENNPLSLVPKPFRQVEIKYSKLGEKNPGLMHGIIFLVFGCSAQELRRLTLGTTTRPSLLVWRSTSPMHTATACCK